MSLFYLQEVYMKRIEVISIDRIGLVQEISKVIRRLNGNIISHTSNVLTDSHHVPVSHFTADILFDTAAENESVLRRLRKIRNVKEVKITDL